MSNESHESQVTEAEDCMIPLFPGVDIKKSLAAAREHKAKLEAVEGEAYAGND